MKNGDVSLVLKNVTTADDGSYNCNIFNKVTKSWESINTVSLTVSAQNTVTAKSGQDVVLPCRVPSDKTIRAVKWIRADLGDNYVLLYRDERLDPENQHPSFKNRVDLQDRNMNNGDVSLVLKNVTTADDGSYNCKIFSGGTTSWESINTVSLTVSAQNTVTAKSGQDVVLPCRVPSDKTIRAVKWNRADLGKEYVLLFRDEQLDPEEQHVSFKNRVDLQDRKMNNGDVSLVLKNVTTADDGSYNCNIFNGGTTSWESINTVSLTVSGQTGGGTEDGSVGLIVGLSVSALLLVAAVVGFLIYRKHKQPQSQDSY
ncbi:signal-regulatory protein beta-2 [Oreochromis niloticus]|uniref:signal-regulatory protein beta-2 n=1 Tax=Oreochromis niloticus TaxID=8128 RepID=UPI000DF3F666|nr:signal-regulatory protein beta-2 [Oreochromis niloticus]